MYTREELEAEGLTDFRVFLMHLWEHLNLPEPTKLQMDIAKYLQYSDSNRIIVEAFRGVGKSWITVGYVLWTLLLDPQKQVMVVSAGEDLAANFVRFCMQLIKQWPLLHHLAPGPGQRSSTLSFDVGPATPKKDPSVVCKGIKGQLTGGRCDLAVLDDVETPANSQTQHLRDQLFSRVAEVGGAILKPEHEAPWAKVVYLGTPQMEDSLYDRLVKEKGYTVLIWPSEIPSKPDKYIGKDELRGRKNLGPVIAKLIEGGATPGTPTEPGRFPEAVLEKRRTEYGLKDYTLQFMLDTELADMEKFPLKLKDLSIHDCNSEMAPVKVVWGNDPRYVVGDLQAAGFAGDRYYYPAYITPEMAKYTGTVMAIDPSGKGEDETAYAIVKFLNGILYLVDVGGFRDGYGEDTLRTIAGKALLWGVKDIIIETNYGGGMFNSLLEPWLRKVYENANNGQRGTAGRILGPEDDWNGWSSGQKENRIIDVLEPVFRSHRLVVHRKVIEDDLAVSQTIGKKYSLVHQATRMWRVRGALAHEDRLEAVAMACDFFTERMNRDADKAHEDHRRRQQEEELKKFMKSARALHGSGRPNWTGGSGWRR